MDERSATGGDGRPTCRTVGRRAAARVAIVAVMLASGCGRTPAPAERPQADPATDAARARAGAAALANPPSRAAALGKAAAPGRTTVTYPLTGKVVSVEPDRRKVVIRHDAIPGFMDAMSMPFTLRDASAFEDLHAGDEVEGTLRVEKEGAEVADYELTGLVVARPAPPPALKLSLGADGQATLTTAPRRLEPGEMVPDFTMTTQDGTSLKLSDMRGKVVVLTFIYTRCPLPNFCPAMDDKFARLAAALAAVPRRAEGVRLLSVSFDPEHDTPAVLAAHAKMRGATRPLWTFAVATHPELARVAGALGLTYGPTGTEVVHNLSTAVIGPDGRLVRLETDDAARSASPADLLKTIYSRLTPTNG